MQKQKSMKTNSFFSMKYAGLIVLSILLFSLGLIFTACNNEEDKGEPYFTIEGDPIGLSVTTAAKTQSYVVRSNRPWQIVAQSEGDWVKAFPAEGEDDGIFKMIVTQNDLFNPRVMDFAIVVDGEEQPVYFRVEQAANVPFITITEATSGVLLAGTGGTCSVNITSNVAWTYSLADASWLTEVSKTANKVTLSAGLNAGEDRSTVMTVTSVDYPSVTATVTISQATGVIIMDERFNWLEGSTTQIFYLTTDADRYDDWPADLLAHGWTSTLNTVSNDHPLYACTGNVKLGKTKYGGDIISPKFILDGTKDVKVTFKAVPYMTKGGTKDDNYLNISVLGAGTPSMNQFVIDNWPDYPVASDEIINVYCTAFWNNADTVATRTFTITGATSETQIKFLGGDYNLTTVGTTKNRIFLDDIKVEIIVP